MPGTRCAVAICNNSLVKTKQRNPQIMYHKFPKDERTLKCWINACCRKQKWNPKTSVVCSQHFEEDDYKRDLQSELLGLKPKRKLKRSAVPSLFLKPDSTGNHGLTPGSRFKKAVISEIVTTTASSNTAPLEATPSSSQLQNVLQQHAALKVKYKKMEESLEEHKKKLESSQQMLQNITKKFQDECHIRRRLEETLGEIFSKSQRELIINKNNDVGQAGAICTRETFRCSSNPPELYHCKLCPFNSDLKLPLTHHVRVYHERNSDYGALQRKFQCVHCKNCDFDSFSMLLLLNHVYKSNCKRDTNVKPIKWSKCVAKVTQHYKNKTVLNFLKCEQCSYKTYRKSFLEQHVIAKHTDLEYINWFVCNHCSFKTKQNSNLRTHILLKHTRDEDIKWFKCEQCSFKTKINRNLRLHCQRKHSD